MDYCVFVRACVCYFSAAGGDNNLEILMPDAAMQADGISDENSDSSSVSSF